MQEQSSSYQSAIAFFHVAQSDNRLNSTHVSLYFALFESWLRNDCQTPFSITRKLLMEHAKIKSTATYTHCIYDLHHFGYITYQPSYHPAIGSFVYLHKLQ